MAEVKRQERYRALYLFRFLLWLFFASISRGIVFLIRQSICRHDGNRNVDAIFSVYRVFFYNMVLHNRINRCKRIDAGIRKCLAKPIRRK